MTSPTTAFAPMAPEWAVDDWLNTDTPLSLDTLRGRVVVLLSFQMLCPGCVAQALPQASRVHAAFPRDEVAMVGLHTVFEHHEAMTPAALRAFVHEYRLTFPIGIDRPVAGQSIPATMRAYAMHGTPTWTLIDRDGRVRAQHFGELDPRPRGPETALRRAGPGGDAPAIPPPEASIATGCADGACAVPAHA